MSGRRYEVKHERDDRVDRHELPALVPLHTIESKNALVLFLRSCAGVGEGFTSAFAFGGAIAGEKLAQQFLRGTAAADAGEVVLHVGL